MASFEGNTLGEPKSLTDRPQTPSFYIAGLTSVLTPRLINDFRFSYTRNSWEWGSAGARRNCLASEQPSSSALLPYETARGNALSRYWNGHDYVLRDDLSLVHGNHLFQFGGTYTRWLLQHQRNDNGLNMITTPTYVVGPGEGIATPAAYIPSTVPSREYGRWNSLYAQALGLVSRDTRILSTAWRSSATLWDLDQSGQRSQQLQRAFQRHLEDDPDLYADLWVGI